MNRTKSCTKYFLVCKIHCITFFRGESIRYLCGSWPNNSAVLDAKTTSSGDSNQDNKLQGIVKIDVPLQTRHEATIIYGLQQKAATTHGHTTIEYNEKNVLNGQYTSKLETIGETEKRAAQITLKNEFFPIGVNYQHTVNDSYVSITLFLSLFIYFSLYILLKNYFSLLF